MAKNYNAVNLPITSTPTAVDGNLYWNNAIGRPRIRMASAYQDVPGWKLLGISTISSDVTIPSGPTSVSTGLSLNVTVEAGRRYMLEYQVDWYNGSTTGKQVRTYIDPSPAGMSGRMNSGYLTNIVAGTAGFVKHEVRAPYVPPSSGGITFTVRANAPNTVTNPGAILGTGGVASGEVEPYFICWDTGVS